jgi:hypothetical protein
VGRLFAWVEAAHSWEMRGRCGGRCVGRCAGEGAGACEERRSGSCGERWGGDAGEMQGRLHLSPCPHGTYGRGRNRSD